MDSTARWRVSDFGDFARRAGRGLPEAQIVAGELADNRAPHEFHIALDLRAQQTEGPLRTRLAGRGQRVEVVAADAYGLGSEREGLQHMGASLDASVHQHIDAVANAIDNLGELIKGGT